MFYFLFLGLVQGIFFTLNSKTEFCIGVEVKKSKELWGDYVISGEGDKNVITTLYDPKNIVEYISEKDTREGKFAIKKPAGGIHRTCFKATDGVQKTVSLEINTEEPPEDKVITEEEIEPFQINLKRALRSIESINRNLHFYQRREKVHRDLTEKTCDRVLWTAVIKLLTIFSISLLQGWGVTKLLSSSQTSKI
jgi:hypothetical protein